MRLPPLYAILDVDVVAAHGWTTIDVCERWLAAGVQLIQLRAKHLSLGPLLSVADAVQSRCARADARLIINDRADVAAISGAAGVHVGQDDLTPEDVRALVGPQAIVGVSTHTTAQVALAVQSPVTYLAVGPVFETSTKQTGYDAVGLTRLAEARTMAGTGGGPVVAIGGISRSRAASVFEAGADVVAVVGDLLHVDSLDALSARAAEWVAVAESTHRNRRTGTGERTVDG